MKWSLDEVMKRLDAAWSNRENWVSLYEDAYTYAMPNRNTYYEQQEGTNRQVVLYDSTLQLSTIKLAGALQSNITRPFTKWGRLIPGPYVTENITQTAQILEFYSDALFAALKTSNFDAVVGEYYLDLLVGTAVMLVLEGDDETLFRFASVPISQVALEEGPYSDIGAVYRKFKKAYSAIQATWPDMKKPDGWDKYVKDNPNKKADLLEATYYDYDGKQWYYVVIIRSYGESGDKNIMLTERKYNLSPFLVSRWIKNSGEVFGRGPILVALPDAKTANMAKKLELQNASLAAAGVWLARNHGFLNPSSIKIQPGAIIPVMSTGGSQGADIAELQGLGRSIQYTQVIQSELKQNIKDAMFDRSIPEPGPVRSATEWIVRAQELQESIGAPFARLFQEFLMPLFRLMLDIMKRKKIITDDINLGNGYIDIQMSGTLAQAQSSETVESIYNWLTIIQSVLGPDGLKLIAKPMELASGLAQLMGVPSKYLNTEEEIAAAMQQVQQAIQQQQQMQQPQPIPAAPVEIQSMEETI